MLKPVSLLLPPEEALWRLGHFRMLLLLDDMSDRESHPNRASRPSFGDNRFPIVLAEVRLGVRSSMEVQEAQLVVHRSTKAWATQTELSALCESYSPSRVQWAWASKPIYHHNMVQEWARIEFSLVEAKLNGAWPP